MNPKLSAWVSLTKKTYCFLSSSVMDSYSARDTCLIPLKRTFFVPVCIVLGSGTLGGVGFSALNDIPLLAIVDLTNDSMKSIETPLSITFSSFIYCYKVFNNSLYVNHCPSIWYTTISCWPIDTVRYSSKCSRSSNPVHPIFRTIIISIEVC